MRLFPKIFAFSPVLFGGTFDPPHLGHVKLLEELSFFFPRLFVMPTAQPRWKQGPSPFEKRLKMCEKAFSHLASVLAIENKIQCHGTEELLLWARSFWKAIPVFVVGTDQWAKIESWYHFPAFLPKAHWLVVERKGHPSFEEASQKLFQKALLQKAGPFWQTEAGTWLVSFQTTAPALSAESIRKNIQEESWDAIEEALPPSLLSWIQSEGLYKKKAF